MQINWLFMLLKYKYKYKYKININRHLTILYDLIYNQFKTIKVINVIFAYNIS